MNASELEPVLGTIFFFREPYFQAKYYQHYSKLSFGKNFRSGRRRFFLKSSFQKRTFLARLGLKFDHIFLEYRGPQARAPQTQEIPSVMPKKCTSFVFFTCLQPIISQNGAQNLHLILKPLGSNLTFELCHLFFGLSIVKRVLLCFNIDSAI